MNRAILEEQLSQLPLLQFEFFSTDVLTFTPRVRHICETECPMYNKTWACPPGVGTVEACKEKCLRFPEFLLFATVTEVNDVENMEETLATRADHEAITHQVTELVKAQGCETMTLSTEACAICKDCTYPNGPCRHPELMFPCVESHGILVTELFEKFGIEFYNGNLVTWFSLVFFR